jgi:hypothetical protein
MNPLFNRDISAFPLSIGTSLAFESVFTGRLPAFDPERTIPNKVILSSYDSCYINIATLYRNIAGAVDKEVKLQSNENHYAEVVEQEMDIIQSLFKVEGGGTTTPIFYTMTYDKAVSKAKSKIVDLRQDRTDLQKHERAILVKTIEKLKQIPSIEKYKDYLKTSISTKALIMTHVPFDLLSHQKMGKLDLLESHTGKLKPRYEWGSKFYPLGDRDMSHLPFIEKLLLIFGDKVLIQPALTKIRQQVYDVSIKRGWTSMTTKAKVVMDLSTDIPEPMIARMLAQL